VVAALVEGVIGKPNLRANALCTLMSQKRSLYVYGYNIASMIEGNSNQPIH
jgi:hypothetical protein